jgi:D-3-phosphoglycerate dehydrogenase
MRHARTARHKAVRTDRELECPEIDAGPREREVGLVTLPDGTGEDALIAAAADLLLMCYTPITARVSAAARLKGIVNYGVGIGAIDIPMARGIPVVNVPEYAEETLAEGAFAPMIALSNKLMPIGREKWRDPRLRAHRHGVTFAD